MKKSIKIFDFALIIFCIHILYECLFLETSLVKQKAYYNNVPGSALQNAEHIYLLDIPRDHIHLLSKRMGEEWSKKEVEIAKQMSYYKTYPVFYKEIVSFYEKNNDAENYAFWRSKALHLIGKHQVKSFKELFPKENL